MLRCLLVLAVGLLPLAVGAGDWTFSQGVTVKETYTDNLRLTDSDQEDEWITEIRPTIGLHGKGRRFEADLDYGLQYLNYAGESSNKVYHQLQADSNTELARDHLFLNARASVGQALIDSLGRSGSGVENRTGNLETTSTYTVNPYYTTRIGSHADAKLSYTNDGVLLSKGSDDSVANTVSAELKSGERYQRTPWTLQARQQEINYADSEDSRYRSATGRLGYVLDRQWSVDGSVGYDDNSYGNTTSSDTKGARWDGRVIWTPNARTSLAAGMGRRYFGKTPSLDFSHISKRTTWTASYRKDVIDFRTARVSMDWDRFGEAVIATPETELTPAQKEFYLDLAATPEGRDWLLAHGTQTLLDNFGQSSINSNTYISERFQTFFGIKGNRSTAGLTAYHETREYEGLATEEEVMGLTLHGSHRLTGLLSANANLTWQQDESQNDPLVAEDRDVTTWRAALGLSRPLSSHLNGNVQYQYSDRNSNIAGDDYTENKLWMSVSADWR